MSRFVSPASFHLVLGCLRSSEEFILSSFASHETDSDISTLLRRYNAKFRNPEGEDDLPRIKRSLQVIYKSGDLLLHLLNDLLTFSKNQIGQQLSLEEKEFRLVDIKSQITVREPKTTPRIIS
jgi:signal transduction histidine kinase